MSVWVVVVALQLVLSGGSKEKVKKVQAVLHGVPFKRPPSGRKAHLNRMKALVRIKNLLMPLFLIPAFLGGGQTCNN